MAVTPVTAPPRRGPARLADRDHHPEPRNLVISVRKRGARRPRPALAERNDQTRRRNLVIPFRKPPAPGTRRGARRTATGGSAEQAAAEAAPQHVRTGLRGRQNRPA